MYSYNFLSHLVHCGQIRVFIDTKQLFIILNNIQSTNMINRNESGKIARGKTSSLLDYPHNRFIYTFLVYRLLLSGGFGGSALSAMAEPLNCIKKIFFLTFLICFPKTYL